MSLWQFMSAPPLLGVYFMLCLSLFVFVSYVMFKFMLVLSDVMLVLY